MSTATLSGLSPEIKLNIFNFIPNLRTLKRLIIASREFHDVFKASSTTSDSILLKCLYQELGYEAAHEAVIYCNALSMIVKDPVTKKVNGQTKFLSLFLNDAREAHGFPWTTGDDLFSLQAKEEKQNLADKHTRAEFVAKMCRNQNTVRYLSENFISETREIGFNPESDEILSPSIGEQQKIYSSFYRLFTLVLLFREGKYCSLAMEQENFENIPDFNRFLDRHWCWEYQQLKVVLKYLEVVLWPYSIVAKNMSRVNSSKKESSASELENTTNKFNHVPVSQLTILWDADIQHLILSLIDLKELHHLLSVGPLSLEARNILEPYFLNKLDDNVIYAEDLPLFHTLRMALQKFEVTHNRSVEDEKLKPLLRKFQNGKGYISDTRVCFWDDWRLKEWGYLSYDEILQWMETENKEIISEDCC